MKKTFQSEKLKNFQPVLLQELKPLPPKPKLSVLDVLIFPLITVGLYLALFRYVLPSAGNFYAFFVASALVGIVMSMLRYADKWGRWKKERKKAERENQQIIEQKKAESLRNGREFKKGMEECYPSLSQTMNWDWVRTPLQKSFWTVRLGVHSEQNPAHLAFQDAAAKRALAPEFQTAVEQTQTLSNVPYSLDLKKHHIIGVYGPQKETVFNSVLMNAVVFHSEEDLRVCILNAGKAARSFSWCRKILQANDDPEGCLYAETPSEIYRLIELLAQKAASKDGKENLLVLTSDQFLQVRRVRELAKLEHLVLLVLCEGKPTSDCDVIIGEQSVAFSDRVEVDEVQLDQLPLAVSEAYVQWNAVRRSGPAAASQKQAVTLPKMLDAFSFFGPPDHLKQLEKSRTGFSFPIGQTVRNGQLEPAVLTLTDDAAHGVLGGKSGSGKSELALTIFVSLAMYYSPEEVNFVVIDFKSGSTSELVSDFPHCAGTATDLQSPDAIARTIALLKAESARRQKFLMDAVRKGIISKVEASEYREARKKDPSLPPLPLLLIVVDEYGQLKKCDSTFDDQLNTIAKQGRCQFMYLLRIDNWVKTFAGTDNTLYQIRVGVPDLQNAREAWDASLRAEETIFSHTSAENEVHKGLQGRGVLSADGTLVLFQAPFVRAKTTEGRSQLDEYRSYIKQQYEGRGIIAHRVLSELLPTHYCGDAGQFFRGYSSWSGRYLFRTDGNIPIGLLDDTTRNEKRLYTVAPFRKNLLFLGNKGCGKTTALKTVLFGVTQNISPEKCNIIVLNFGEPGSFDEYRDLPHFCDVLDLGVGAKRESREKLERLPTILRQIIRNQSSVSQEKKTKFLLVIDGYLAFADSCPKIELEMQTLLVEGKAAGISLVIANRQFRTIPSEVRNSLQQRILLRSEDLDADLISEGTRRNQASRLCSGRGIVAAEDGRYFEMQLSFPACVPPEQYLAAVKDYARSYYDKNSYRAKAIPFMPEVLSLEPVRAKAVGSGCNVFFGLDYADLQPVGLSLREMDCVFIEGTDRSGKSFLIAQILRQLKRMPSKCMVLFLDGKGKNPMPSGSNLTYIGSEKLFVFLKSIENISFEAERETVVLVDDMQALYDEVAAKDKSVYDRFYRWLNVQRASNRHVHFVLSCAAEANGYEVLPGFRFRERILLGNMMMQRRFAAPDALKNSYQNTTLAPYDAWIDLAGRVSRVKLLNR